MICLDGYIMLRSDITGNDFFEAPLLDDGTSSEAPSEGSAKIVDSVAYLHDDNGSIGVYVSAIIENTSDSAIQITNVSCDLEDENGAYLMLIDDYSFSEPCPSIVQPGEQTYVAGYTFDYYDILENSEMSVVALMHIEYEETDLTVTAMEVESAEIIEFSGSYYGINGRVINPYDYPVEDAYAAVALFDDNDEYMGLIVSRPLDTIERNGKMGIPDAYTPLPQVFSLDDIKTIVPMAYAK